MTARYKLGLTMLSCTILGGLANEALHAQAADALQDVATAVGGVARELELGHADRVPRTAGRHRPPRT